MYFNQISVDGMGCLSYAIGCTRAKVMCMSSKGFEQIGFKNKRRFQVSIILFQVFKQPLMSDYTSYAGALYFS